jgi:hypothetical protein
VRVIGLFVWVNVNPELTVKLAKLKADAGPVDTFVLIIISSPATGKPAGDQVTVAQVPAVIEVLTTAKALNDLKKKTQQRITKILYSCLVKCLLIIKIL